MQDSREVAYTNDEMKNLQLQSENIIYIFLIYLNLAYVLHIYFMFIYW